MYRSSDQFPDRLGERLACIADINGMGWLLEANNDMAFDAGHLFLHIIAFVLRQPDFLRSAPQGKIVADATPFMPCGYGQPLFSKYRMAQNTSCKSTVRGRV
jgi:hypothetical protein